MSVCHAKCFIRPQLTHQAAVLLRYHVLFIKKPWLLGGTTHGLKSSVGRLRNYEIWPDEISVYYAELRSSLIRVSKGANIGGLVPTKK